MRKKEDYQTFNIQCKDNIDIYVNRKSFLQITLVTHSIDEQGKGEI